MTSERLSTYVDSALTQTWVYCCNELKCGHLVKLSIHAAIDTYGDMPVNEFRRRLRCSKCGERARMITSFE
jgi:hypothetical protein